MTMKHGDRVRVKGAMGYEGTVHGSTWDGNAYVKLDQGSAGAFKVDDLIPLVAEDKAWPPKGPGGIETK